VSFVSGPTTLCHAAVSDGSATCPAPASLKVGTYHVTATYSGDANFTTSSATTVFRVT
jgi:hypothetical protein